MNAPSDEITIVKKPWGREIIYARCEHYLGKVIEISEGHRLSLQAHVEKDETIYVLEGFDGNGPDARRSPGLDGGCFAGNGFRRRATTHLQPGQAFRIRPGTVHRFAAPYGAVRVLEVSTPHPERASPGDVVRFSMG